MVKQLRVLVVDDDPAICNLYVRSLQKRQVHAQSAHDLETAIALLQNQRFDGIFLDLFLGDVFTLDFMRQIFHDSPGTRILVLTGNGKVEYAVAAMKRGASGFLLKSDRVDSNLDWVLDTLAPRGERSVQESLDLEAFGVIGKSKAVQHLGAVLQKLRKVDSTIVIQGESGTGKELLAQAIHNLSQRAQGPFIGINCAAIAENILESELFGYKKGAFTDAKTDRRGYFETCSEGTLFLDEVAEMPFSLQAKLLRVLQEKEVTPLGSCTPISIHTRVLCATNRDLKAEVDAGRFRADLYYRLSVFEIHLPSLKERSDDIPALVKHFLDYHNRRFGKSVQMPSPLDMSYLMSYDWPGNIRELQNAIERTVVLSEGNEFTLEDAFANHQTLPSSPVQEFPCELNYRAAKDFFERHYIRNLLAKTNGNVTEAAKVSGQYRPNLYRLMKKFGFETEDFRNDALPLN